MLTSGIFAEYIILIPGVTWIVTQILKISIHGRYKGMSTLAEMFKSGGMPSAHSSFMTSLAIAVGLKDGFNSTLFAVSLGLAAIVIYDAIHVRLESGKHASVFNELYKSKTVSTPSLKSYYPFETSIGHTPLQALVGGILGIGLGALLFYI